MASLSAAQFMELAVRRVERLHKEQTSGGIPVDTPQQLQIMVDLLDEVSMEFTDALHELALSSVDDLLLHNSLDAVVKHIQAYKRSEQLVAAQTGPDSIPPYELATAAAVADAAYTELSEEEPLRPVSREKQSPFLIIPLPRQLLVSGIHLRTGKVVGAVKRRRQQQPQRVTRQRRQTEPELAPLPENVEALTDRLFRQSQRRARSGQRPKMLQDNELPREVLRSAFSLRAEEWLDWARLQLQQPSTSILDMVAGASAVISREPFILTAFTFNQVVYLFRQRAAETGETEGSGEQLSTRLSADRIFSGRALLNSFSWLYQSAGQLNTVLQANTVELLYNFMTLTTPAGTEALSRESRLRWLRFAQRWSPFISLALALVLVAGNAPVAAWLLSGDSAAVANMKLLAASVETAASTPGLIVTSLASSWLPADSVVVSVLNAFYQFAADGITKLQKPQVGKSSAELAVESMDFIAGSFVTTTINWLMRYITFVMRLHRLRFAAPMLHLFSLVEFGALRLAEAWRWAAQKMQTWLASKPPGMMHQFIDWLVDLSDMLVLLIRFFAQLFRYRGLLLLLLNLVQALMLHGIGLTNNALAARLPFELGPDL